MASVCSSFAFAAIPSQLIGKDLDKNRDLVNSAMYGRNYMVEVDRKGKIKQIIDAGANGDGKDPLQVINSASATKKGLNVASIELPENYQGQNAIDRIGRDLPKIAQNYGLTPGKLKEILLNDATARLDSNNRLFYVDNPAEQQANLRAKETTVVDNIIGGSSINNPTVPISSPTLLANAFKLHTKPGASKTIYLDFDGHTASNTAWSRTIIVAPAYDLTGNATIFDDTERSNIISIWNRVAEDYIPFDVDVTTEPPSTDALLRTSAADNTYGTRVAITKTGTINCSCGGVAYVGVVSMVNNTSYQPAWVFQQSLANNEKYIAEAISHEAGHTLGLLHDGLNIGGTITGYYTGHGAGTTGWAPIMGVGYYQNVTQWDHGAYPNANNQQDDFSVFASNDILPRADDVGNTTDTASSLTNISTTSSANIQTFGVIETSSDIDMYSLNTYGGTVNLAASPAAKGPNLDIQLTLYDIDGNVLATDAPVDNLSATINTTVPPGNYFLAVSGSDRPQASVRDYGYSNYGSLGQYQITGSFDTDSTAVPPTAVITVPALAGIVPFTANFSANDSVGNGAILGYQWSFGDGATSTSSTPVYTYTKIGNYTASLTVTNQYQLTNTITVPITVSAPPLPSIYASSVSMKIIKNSKITGQVNIKVVDTKGRAITNATVAGTWSGAFTGSVSSKTASNGVAVQKSNAIPLMTGASGTYTLDSITASGYAYDPTKNAKTVVTMTW